MPYRDPEDRRRYDRERKRGLRAASRFGVGPVPPPVRLRVAADVEALLAEAVELVRRDPKARGTERARALGYLASIALRLIETHDLQERLEALERVLALRSEASGAA
jgi:hypothetical protein